MLDQWLAWACRCRIGPFVELAAMIRRHRVAIEAALIHGLSNARIEAVNTKIRPPAANRLRLPGTPGPHRHGHAGPRRVLPEPAWALSQGQARTTPHWRTPP